MLPTCVGVDVIRLLRLWDYEASLGDRERAAILGALQREVVRVHRQLALAAQELRPSGTKLAALQTWDVAYSQVRAADEVLLLRFLHTRFARRLCITGWPVLFRTRALRGHPQSRSEQGLNPAPNR